MTRRDESHHRADADSHPPEARFTTHDLRISRDTVQCRHVFSNCRRVRYRRLLDQMNAIRKFSAAGGAPHAPAGRSSHGPLCQKPLSPRAPCSKVREVLDANQLGPKHPTSQHAHHCGRYSLGRCAAELNLSAPSPRHGEIGRILVAESYWSERPPASDRIHFIAANRKLDSETPVLIGSGCESRPVSDSPDCHIANPGPPGIRACHTLHDAFCRRRLHRFDSRQRRR